MIWFLHHHLLQRIFHYTLIFWAIILGYLVYDDLPNIPTIVGAIIIAASGIYVLREGKQRIEQANKE